MNRDIKYILKRVIIGVLIGFILFSLKSCNVKALTNDIIGNDVEFPLSNVAMISMNSDLRITNTGYRYFHGSTLNPTLYFASPTGTNYTCGTYGCGVNIGGLTLLKDNYYSITIYLLGDNSPNWHYSYSAYNNTYNIAVNSSFQTYNSSAFIKREMGTTQIGKVCSTIFDNEYTGNCLFTWSLLFKAPNNGTNLSTWWSSTPTGGDPFSNGFFVGYKLDYVGDSSLTPSELTSILNTMTTNITTSINNNINTSTENIIDAQQNTTDAINELNDTIKDGTVDSPNNGINAVKNGLASNGVITQLITLPVTLFQQILTSINGTCQTFNLGSLFGTDLLLPCINVSDYLGNTLWGIIDVIISGYFVWVIARKMISAFEMFSAMKDGDVLDD